MKNVEIVMGLTLLIVGILIGFFVEPVIGTGIILIGSMVSAAEAVDFFAEEES